MEADQWLEKLEKEEPYITPAQLLALDPMLIDYLVDTGCYNSKIFTRRIIKNIMGGPKSIVVSLAGPGTVTRLPI